MIDTISRLLSFLGRVITWCCIVQPWEAAICVRLGKHIRPFGPGIHFVVPFADAVYVQNVRVRVIHCNDQTVTTLDGKPLCVTGNISFQVVDIQRLYAVVHQPEYVIRRDVQSAIAEYISTRSIFECRASELEAHVNKTVDLAAYGLSGSGFCLTDWLTVRALRIINQGLGEWIGSNFNTDQRQDPSSISAGSPS